ncbi:MFS transporter [Anaplasmataceae bacterium AB001_6]|nr:MFS transporter [Anaplasmataceae bacterium AB001_6]
MGGNDSENQNNGLYDRKNILAWIIISLFFCYQYFTRVLPSSMTDILMEKLMIDGKMYGQIVGIYYISYTAMHIPLGLLYDKIGIRKVLTFGIFSTVIGTATLIYSNSFIWTLIGRFITGMGSASAPIGIFQIIIMTFPKRQFALFLGFSLFVGLSGAAYSSGPMIEIIQKFGYVDSINILLIVGLLLGILAIFTTPNTITGNAKQHGIVQEFKTLFKYPMLIIFPAIGGFLIGPLEGFADAWANTLYKLRYGIDQQSCYSLANAYLFGGFIFGSLIMGYVVSKFPKNCMKLTLLCAIAMVITFALILYSDISIRVLLVVNLILGISCAYQTLVVHKVTEISPKEISGLTTSTANMIMMIFGYLFHTTIGYVISAKDPMEKFVLITSDKIIDSLSIIFYGLAIGVLCMIFLSIKEYRENSSR